MNLQETYKYDIGNVIKIKPRAGRSYSGKVGIIISQEGNWGMNGYVIGYYVMVAGDPINELYFREDELELIK